jgi:hypothetical protein
MSRSPILILLTFFVAAPVARGVIAAKTPPSAIYTASTAVVTAKVTKVSPETGILEATATTLTGQPFGDTLKIKLIDLPAILSVLKPDAPVVLFLGRRSSSNALHLADTWLFPEPVSGSKSNFVVKKDLQANLRQSYPGTTAALVKLATALKAGGGKSPMLNEVSPKVFHGGTKPLLALQPPPSPDATIFSVSLTGDKRHDLLVADADKFTVTRLAAAGDTLSPPGRPLDSAPDVPTTGLIAATVVDATGGNKAALLTLHANGELRIAPIRTKGEAQSKKLWPDTPPSIAAAAAFGSFGEDPDRIYAMVVKDDNIYRYALDGSSPPADFVRLTGEPVSNYHKDNPKWLAGATAHPLDCNGDGRADVLINTPAGPLLLINRGFGAFFINADLGKILVDPAGKPLLAGKTRWTCADVDADGHDDLVLIDDGGKVTAVLNPRVEEKK